MPIEVRELVVRARIGDAQGRAGQEAPPARAEAGAELVRDALEQWEQIMKRRNER